MILCIDIEGFAAPHRTDADQIAVRDAFYSALRSAFAGGGLVWEDCYLEDRGDGALVLVPPAVPTHILLAAVSNELAAVLREHNRNHRPEARIRLRLSIHAGEVQDDSHGMVGQSINLAFRLLDSPSFKRAGGLHGEVSGSLLVNLGPFRPTSLAVSS